MCRLEMVPQAGLAAFRCRCQVRLRTLSAEKCKIEFETIFKLKKYILVCFVLITDTEYRENIASYLSLLWCTLIGIITVKEKFSVKEKFYFYIINQQIKSIC